MHSGRRRVVALAGIPALALLLLGLALAALALAPATLAAPAAPVPQSATPTVTTFVVTDTLPNPATGRALYGQNCAACHGTTGKGDGPSASGLSVPPASLIAPEFISTTSLADWFAITKNGRMERMMPPWRNRLSDRQIADTVAYAWSLHTSADELNTGKALYADNCATCHGADGKGKPPMLDLTDFTAASAVSQATWVKLVANGRGTMPGFGDKLSAADQQAVTEYVRSLSMQEMFPPRVEGQGVITGTVTNGTTKQPMAGLTVTLGIFEGQTPINTLETTSGPDGSYRFEKLVTDGSTSYAVTTQYPQNFPYGTDLASFEAGQTTLSLPVTVYETTNDGSGVRAERVHFIVEYDQGQLLVAELLVFGLDGDRTYVGGNDGVVLRVTLPEGAQDLSIEGAEAGGRFQPTADGFVDTMALPPGSNSRQLLYRYSIPYSGTVASMLRSLPYPMANVNALIGDAGAKVTVEGLASQGVRQTQAGNYLSFTGANLAANSPVTLHFENLPLPGATTGASGTSGSSAGPVNSSGLTTLLLLLGGLVGVGILGFASYGLARSRRAGANGWADGGEYASDRDALVDELAELELAAEAGDISDADYRDRRLRLKAALADALRQENAAQLVRGRAHGR